MDIANIIYKHLMRLSIFLEERRILFVFSLNIIKFIINPSDYFILCNSI